MSAQDKRIIGVGIGVLVVLWLLKRGGVGFGLQAGPVAFGAGITGAGLGGSTSSAGGGGGAAGSSGGCCGGCAGPARGPIVGSYGDFSQGGLSGKTLSVPQSWINTDVSQSPGWINIPFGGA